MAFLSTCQIHRLGGGKTSLDGREEGRPPGGLEGSWHFILVAMGRARRWGKGGKREEGNGSSSGRIRSNGKRCPGRLVDNEYLRYLLPTEVDDLKWLFP